MENVKVKNLYLDAGGIYGFSMCGALQVLQNMNLLRNIENILAASVGSILGLYLCLGFTTEQITYLGFKIDISKFINYKQNNFLNIYRKYGFEKGTNFENVIKIIIKHKIGNPNATFKELYEYSGKNLILVGANVSTLRHELFSYQHTPDMEVWKAVRISCSFPLVFEPFIYKGNYYVDGGNSHYNPSYFQNTEETIGILLEKSVGDNEPISCFEDFFIKMLYMPLKSQKFKNYIPDNCIEIDSTKFIVNSLNLNITEKTKTNLYKLGYNEVSEKIDNIISNLIKIKNKKIYENSKK